MRFSLFLDFDTFCMSIKRSTTELLRHMLFSKDLEILCYSIFIRIFKLQFFCFLFGNPAKAYVLWAQGDITAFVCTANADKKNAKVVVAVNRSDIRRPDLLRLRGFPSEK